MDDLKQRFLKFLDSEKAIWTVSIGRFVVAWGAIEMLVDWLLAHLTGGPLDKKVAKMGFVSRAKRAIRAIQANVQDDARRNLLVGAINDAIKISNARNSISHNPIRFGVFEDEQGIGRPCLEIRPFREDAIVIRFGELEELVEKAERIADCLDDFEPEREVAGVRMHGNEQDTG